MDGTPRALKKKQSPRYFHFLRFTRTNHAFATSATKKKCRALTQANAGIIFRVLLCVCILCAGEYKVA
jgi:hypothetical protein